MTKLKVRGVKSSKLNDHFEILSKYLNKSFRVVLASLFLYVSRSIVIEEREKTGFEQNLYHFRNSS